MTVQELINAALRTIGVLASGESPSSEESADGLAALNQLVASWTAQALPIYQITRESFPLTGALSYTIGTGQTFNTVRPIKIKAASVISMNNIAKAVRVVSAEEWATVLDKAATGTFAEVLFYDGGFPSGTIRMAPVPLFGSSLELYSYKPLSQFASLGDSISLPDGYLRALRFNLAVDLAPEFGRVIDPTLAAIANDAKTSIFGLNAAVLGPPAPGAVPPAQAPPEAQQ